MRLITKLHIEGFRSVRNEKIDLAADFTAFAGLNNAGKSNVLRALNAFFNDETEPGERLNVDADYFRSDLRKKKRKRIQVTVTFELPNTFKFRAGLEGVNDLLGNGPFTISKRWDRDNPQATFLLNGHAMTDEDRQKLLQFLQLIKYRYIPNRVLPTELIRNEHQSLRDVLVRRLAKRAKREVDAFQAIRDTSMRMVESLARRFEEACPGQGKVALATPTSWNDLAFAFGYLLTRDGIEIKDSEQGAGIQSLLMLETLYLIDRDYFQQFGWRQAAIWAIEEPESSLHTSLEARVAAYLRDIATDPRGRLQVLCTTHSDLMVQYAGVTVFAEHIEGQTKFDSITDPRRALELLARAGVSRWIHPILLYPLDPIVLVEGQYDREFIEEAFRFYKTQRRIRVFDLPALDESAGGGGVDRMRSYIKNSTSAIQARRADAPVVVVLDWDAATRKEEFKKFVKDTPAYKVLAWPAETANSKAGKGFRGIERFHCDRVLEVAIERGAPIGKKTKGPQEGHYVVEASEYEKVKRTLADIVHEGLQETDFIHARAFIKRVLQEARSA